MSSNDSTSRRAELKRGYKEHPPEAGVYAIRNTVDGKVWLAATPNLPGALNRDRFMLQGHLFRACPALQADWDRLGEAHFTFEVLDVLKPSEEPGAEVEEELAVLAALWLERLRPFGEAGYHTAPA